MRKDSEMGDTPHIIVTEVPPGFLKRRTVRNHFSRFGTIVRMSIQSSFCVITFENHDQAREAVLHGTYWKSMPLKIDFTQNHDPFGTDDAIINEELNWFAEDPDYSDKSKQRLSKFKSDSKFADIPPKKLIKMDILDDDEASKSSEESKLKSKWSDKESSTKSSEETKPKTGWETRSSKFFQDVIRGVTKSFDEGKLSRLSEDSNKSKSILLQEIKPASSRPEDFKFSSKSLDEGKLSRLSDQSNKTKSILQQEIKPATSRLSEDFKFPAKSFDVGKTSSKPAEEFKSKSKLVEDSDTVPNKYCDENKITMKALDDNKGTSKQAEENKSDENKVIPKASEENKVSIKANEAPFYYRVATTLQDKLNILEERDKQIRLKLEKITRLDRSTKGTCPDMCPEKERVMRELRGIVAPYESLADGRMDVSKTVKEYARSSADQDEPLPHDLRPEPVLTMTMTYLINCIISRIDEVGDENHANWYDFCWGRLRAIRKDIIQQQLCDKNTVVILEQCARFHIACYDRLWGTSKSQFDDKINTETLVNCLQSLIHMYEDLRNKGISCSNEAEFNAYLILLKINSGFLTSEYQRYSKSLRESALVKEAVMIHMAYNNNMFSTYFRLMKQTSYLNACLMQRFFQHVRIQALNTIVKAHCVPNKLTNISVKFIMDMLKFDSLEDCVSFCESMGLSFSEQEKGFKIFRGDFYIPGNIVVIETPSSIVLSKRKPIAEAVIGTSSTLPIYLNHTVHDSFTDEGILRESALDATDQEEKMLRDDLERHRLISHLKEAFAHKIKNANIVETPSGMTTESEVMITEPSSVDDQNEYLEYSDNEETTEEINVEQPDVEKSLTELEITKQKEMDMNDNNSSQIAVNNKGNLSPKDKFVMTPLPKLVFSPKPLIEEHSQQIHAVPLSPKSPLFSLKNPLTPVKSPESMNKIGSTLQFNAPTMTIPDTPAKPCKPVLKSPQNALENIKSPKPIFEKPFFKVEKTFVKDNTERQYINKLRKKLSENMKKISARKYLRLWKEKARKLKSSRDVESMMVYNMPAKEYMKLWGAASVKHSFNIYSRLSTRKKSNLMVQIILNTDIINKVDKNVRKIGVAVVNTLGKASVQKAESSGNIAQPNPVYWKLVFSLPSPPEGGTMFSTKLRAWCKAAFYNKRDIQLSTAELQYSDSGVPVCTSISVVEGMTNLEECSNLTGLVVLRARDWETPEETTKRITKLLSFKNHPIPVIVLNIGQHIDLVKIIDRSSVTYFEQFLWENSANIKAVLCKLASNVYLYNLKVKPFCFLIEVISEKLFDLLQQDSYLHDGLDNALVDPNNVIFVYNLLIDKVQHEITECKVQNYFGTAFEFRSDLENAEKYFIFPDNYKDVNFEKSFSFRCLQCKLKSFKNDFKGKTDLLAYFKNYCDDIGCLNTFNRLMRQLNLSEEVCDNNLRAHLRSVNWLLFVETLVKAILSSQLLTFKVVYREDVIRDILESHFWFESNIIKK